MSPMVVVHVRFLLSIEKEQIFRSYYNLATNKPTFLHYRSNGQIS
ncbi:hypothetical protein GCM10023228_19390 [Brevibacillus fulvus]